MKKGVVNRIHYINSKISFQSIQKYGYQKKKKNHTQICDVFFLSNRGCFLYNTANLYVWRINSHLSFTTEKKKKREPNKQSTVCEKNVHTC
jgi:hypothetical protein